MKNVLGPAIKQLRIQKKLTQKDLSKLTGFSQNAISNHENQNRAISEIDIKKYSDALGVTPQALFDLAMGETSLNEKETNLLQVFSRLNEERKDSVIHFANFQLSEQRKNVVPLNKTQDNEIHTFAAHRIDDNQTASDEDRKRIHSILDELDRKFDEKNKKQ